MAECVIPIEGRRRIFWTTQIDACGVKQECQSDCGSSGLKLLSKPGGRTFANNNFVTGLALNILLTKGRKADSFCGFRPGARGGHWADTFRDDNQTSGSALWDLPTQYSVAESIKLVKALMQSALQKLVVYGVALSVEVTVTYAGGNTFNAVVDIQGSDGNNSRVGITGSRLENSWVWRS
jgi:phage gp46-like protein